MTKSRRAVKLSARACIPTVLLFILLSSGALNMVSHSTPDFTGKESDTMRIILPNVTPEHEATVKLHGCNIIHRLIDGLAAACPGPFALSLLGQGLAVEDRLVQVFDLESDVYIQADDSWSLGFNGTGVKVAVLDTGVDGTHIELSDSILQSVDFAPGPNVDTIGHGTHVIGIITANGGRQITGGATYNLADPNEATGAAHRASILSVRVCYSQGCRTSDIEAGIEWAVQQGARVINMSLGGGNFPGHCDTDRLATKANWAVDQGVVVVAASGNDASGVSSPACGSKVIAVGAVYQRDIGRQDYSPTCIDQTTSQDQIVCFSNRGPALDLVAPGAGILSTYSCNAAGDCSRTWYAWGWGTSQATPHVSALAALVLSANQSLTPSEVKTILETTARDLGPLGRDDTYGWGLVDAQAAVAKAAGIPRDLAVLSVVPSRTVAYTGGSALPVRITVELANQGGLTESFSVAALVNASQVSSTSVTDLAAGLNTAVSLYWDTNSMSTGHYAIAARANPVTGEQDLANNVLSDGVVEVRKAGDVDGNGIVDLDDLIGVFLNEFTTNSLYDIDNDGDVDLDDVVITFLHQFT